MHEGDFTRELPIKKSVNKEVHLKSKGWKELRKLKTDKNPGTISVQDISRDLAAHRAEDIPQALLERQEHQD